jgi:LmbE family N-acetylglucosaminyl deacetylase
MADVLDDTEVARVLAITAHPDDVDFGAAGTIARWTDAGIEVTYCVVTDGAAGGFDDDFPRAEMPALRQAEQVAAAKCVGVHDVRFLGYPDGLLEATLGLRRDLARVIRQVRPDRVLCPSPERNYARTGASHPDHRAVGSAALDAVYPDARNPFAFPELREREALAPWTVREVWISGSPSPNHYVDVTATFPRKIAALSSHVSQIARPEELAERIRGWLGRAAEQGGLPEGRLAEAFQVLETVLAVLARGDDPPEPPCALRAPPAVLAVVPALARARGPGSLAGADLRSEFRRNSPLTSPLPCWRQHNPRQHNATGKPWRAR